MMINEREIAVETLLYITVNGAYSNIALRRSLALHRSLSRVQKAFVTEIVTGCVRNLIQLDYVIDKISSTPTTKIEPAVLCILRISVFQMMHMDKVPIFAICNEAVNLTKRLGPARLSGFVNGILRNVHRNLHDLRCIQLDGVSGLSTQFSCARWIVEHFVEELGFDAARETLTAFQKTPQITLCVNQNRTTKQELTAILLDEGVEVSDGKLTDSCLTVSKTSDITALPSFQKGLYHVIDESAVMAIQSAMPINGRVIDLCAAPGGKTFTVANFAPTASVLARDIHSHKLDLITDGVRRLGLSDVDVCYGDAAKRDEGLIQTADLVIADVPCSGLGTLAKRPDIKLENRKSLADIPKLVELQRQILAASWEYVRPGGKLLYSTCTISSAENTDNRNWLLDNFPFRPVDFSGQLPDFEGFASAVDGYIQILPQHYNTDGFFIAVFERV